MTHERLKQLALPQSLLDVAANIAVLLKSEMRLARAEISSNLTIKVRAIAWMAIGGIMGLIALMLLVQAVVFGIASYGIALHWSCLIVAGAFFIFATAFVIKGRANVSGDLLPTQTMYQIKRDISIVKEQLT